MHGNTEKVFFLPVPSCLNYGDSPALLTSRSVGPCGEAGQRCAASCQTCQKRPSPPYQEIQINLSELSPGRYSCEPIFPVMVPRLSLGFGRLVSSPFSIFCDGDWYLLMQHDRLRYRVASSNAGKISLHAEKCLQEQKTNLAHECGGTGFWVICKYRQQGVGITLR